MAYNQDFDNGQFVYSTEHASPNGECQISSTEERRKADVILCNKIPVSYEYASDYIIII